MTAAERRQMYVLKILGLVWFGTTTKVERGMALFRNPHYAGAPEAARALLATAGPPYEALPTPRLRKLADRTKRPDWARSGR